MTKQRLLITLAVCGIVLAGLASALIARRLLAHEETVVYLADEVNIDTAWCPFRGDEQATITAVVCFDFMCIYCDSLHILIDSLSRRYGGHVKFYEKPYSLLHKRSEILTRALLASRRQNAYWEMLDALFSLAPRAKTMRRGAVEDGVAHAAEKLHLDGERLGRDMRSKEIGRMVKNNGAEARRYGITSIPIVYLNGCLIKGYRSFDTYAGLIERLIAEQLHQPDAVRDTTSVFSSGQL
ncbi:MAG: thioredoxin domain-containing protein [Chitinispirillaceae bacterium]|nr:thioredoxin domain-containing protein [Chitinispirillaceae bacterium]